MSRLEGFPIADIAVGFLRDVKVRRLRRHLTADELPAAIVLYLAVVLSSWEEGHRLPAEEADSPVDPTPELLAALEAVGLLEDGTVPARAWESWYRPAWERREKMRAAGSEGNRRRWHPDRAPSPPDSPPDSPPVSPSINQSIRPSTPDGASNDDATKRNGREPRELTPEEAAARTLELMEERARMAREATP